MDSHQHQFYLTSAFPGTMTRRPHKKSRAGCLACKKCHIKCAEEKPHCRNCVSKGKVCEYPPVRISLNRDKALTDVFDAQTTPIMLSSSPSILSDIFTLQDLKLFHHFLCFAYPPLPLGSKSAWTRDIPQLSHHSAHLMSAILALASTHLNTTDRDNGDSATTLLHKGRAITGLREACARGNHSAVDYDAMLATCYALTFQSALVSSDNTDFVTFVRGCAMLTDRIEEERCQTVFMDLSRSCNTSFKQSTSPYNLETLSYPPGSRLPALLSKGIASLGVFQICFGARYEHMQYPVYLRSMFSGLETSPGQGYKRFVEYYSHWFRVAEDNEIFSGEAKDSETQLLWVFFLALQLFTTLLVVEVCGRDAVSKALTDLEASATIPSLVGMIEWLYAVEGMAPLQVRKLFAWPRLVAEEVILHFDKLVFAEAGTKSKMAVLSNFYTRAHNVFGDILELSARLANWTEDLLVSKAGKEDIVCNTT